MVKELAFSKVEEDAEGILQLSRSVLVDDDMGWHVQVRLHVYMYVKLHRHTCNYRSHSSFDRWREGWCPTLVFSTLFHSPW